ncbi:hypothetical protein RUND412_009320 [Rhizina undulata]
MLGEKTLPTDLNTDQFMAGAVSTAQIVVNAVKENISEKETTVGKLPAAAIQLAKEPVKEKTPLRPPDNIDITSYSSGTSIPLQNTAPSTNQISVNAPTEVYSSVGAIEQSNPTSLKFGGLVIKGGIWKTTPGSNIISYGTKRVFGEEDPKETRPNKW